MNQNENNFVIIKAGESDLEVASLLFEAYRRFYNKAPNLEEARRFILERMKNEESVIFLVFFEDKPAGFVQLYPTFSSLSMRRVWVLNDMYVVSEFRKQGIGTRLLKLVEDYATETEAISVILETAPGNEIAQQLYVSNGYVRDSEFLHYALKISLE